MHQVTLTVRHEVGLHARPAALFVKTAAKFPCTIRVTNGEKTVNAKSIISVLSLGVVQNTEITLQAEGERAEEALQTLTELIEGNFGEGQ
ncbi:MAG: HPr family phosphocarrier protein [Anaerolineae bacterium]|jgi:phosphotransferase system HPr (HPr) family protein